MSRELGGLEDGNGNGRLGSGQDKIPEFCFVFGRFMIVESMCYFVLVRFYWLCLCYAYRYDSIYEMNYYLQESMCVFSSIYISEVRRFALTSVDSMLMVEPVAFVFY